MSEGKKVDAKEATEKVQIIREMLEDQCKQIVIAGSLRRGKALVGDAEIVALPKYAPNLLARLDRMVAEQLIVKAAYGEFVLAEERGKHGLHNRNDVCQPTTGRAIPQF